MNNFINACEKAYNIFIEDEDYVGISEIRDIGDAWVFEPKLKCILYGVCELMINKNDGKVYLYNKSDPRNVDEYFNSPTVEVPAKYKGGGK